MYYTYVLFSLKDKMFYSGFTPVDPFSRFKKHMNKQVPSTKYRNSFILLYFEGHLNQEDALRRERYFKTNKGRTTLRQINKKALNILHL